MPNYCQNLWEAFGRVDRSQKQCAGVIDAAAKEGESLGAVRTSLGGFEGSLQSMQKEWDESFIQIEAGYLYKGDYEALVKMEASFDFDRLLREKCGFKNGRVTSLDLFQITNFDPDQVAKLTGLEKLNLTQTNTYDIGFVRTLANLKDLSFDQAKDLSPLENLRQLEALTGGFYPDSKLEKLPTAKLQKLIMVINDNADMSWFRGRLPELTELSLVHDGSKKQVQIFAKAPKLERLNFWSAKIDLSPLVKMPALKKLKIMSCRNTNDSAIDLSPLNNLAMEEVELYFSKIRDLSPLLTLPEDCRMVISGVEAVDLDDQKKCLKTLADRGARIHKS